MQQCLGDFKDTVSKLGWNSTTISIYTTQFARPPSNYPHRVSLTSPWWLTIMSEPLLGSGSDHQSIGDLSPRRSRVAVMWPELPGVTIGVLRPGHRRIAATCQGSQLAPVGTNQRPVLWSRDQYWPIRGQHPMSHTWPASGRTIM